MAELEQIINEPSESEKRINQLSKKAKDEAEAREKAEAAAKEATEKAASAERLAQFSEGFVDIVAENPAAKEHKDEIKAKVMAGMSLEDAKFAVLGKAGKLTAPKVEPNNNIAGGSASFTPPQNGGVKQISEMTRDEKRQALMEAPDLVDILRL